MEASQQGPQPQRTSGMWAPYTPPEIGEKLDVLAGCTFVLVDAAVRDPIEVDFGAEGKKMRQPVDLRVQTAEPGVTRLFSGFSAGIVGQVSHMETNDLPALCRIIESNPTGRGTTRGLELVQLLAVDADLATLARAQSPAIMPVRGHDPADPIPY